MNKDLTCYYCKLERPTQAISYFMVGKEKRPICSDCEVAGKYWKDLPK